MQFEKKGYVTLLDYFAKPVKLFICFAAAMLSFMVFAAAADTDPSNLAVGTINVDNGLKLREDSSTSSKILSIVSKGEKVVVYETVGDWCKVGYAGMTGFMMGEYLTITDYDDSELGSGRITGSIVNLRSGAGTSYQVNCQLSRGTIVEMVGVENGWYKVEYDGYTGFIHPDYIEQISIEDIISGTYDVNEETSGLRNQIVEYSKQFIGTKYTYGGRSPSSGFDCSGFVYYVFKNFGYTLNPGATAQLRKVKTISKSELQPGDLVFFNQGKKSGASHVGIYIGGNQFIHAVKPGSPLTISSLSENYYAKYYIASGRVVN